VTYLYDKEEIGLIKFSECQLNWQNNIDHSKEVIEIISCVGVRNMGAQSAYIEFSSNEPVRFFFPMKKRWVEKIFNLPSSEVQDFLSIQLKINEVGFTTYDLT
jgi:hypothetical protein